MNNNVTTALIDICVILALVAISLSIWFYPWISVLMLALLVAGGCLAGKDSG